MPQRPRPASQRLLSHRRQAVEESPPAERLPRLSVPILPKCQPSSDAPSWIPQPLGFLPGLSPSSKLAGVGCPRGQTPSLSDVCVTHLSSAVLWGVSSSPQGRKGGAKGLPDCFLAASQRRRVRCASEPGPWQGSSCWLRLGCCFLRSACMHAPC